MKEGGKVKRFKKGTAKQRVPEDPRQPLRGITVLGNENTQLHTKSLNPRPKIIPDPNDQLYWRNLHVLSGPTN